MKKNQKTLQRQAILQAAIALFGHTHDISKVSLETIAKAGGVSPATLYNYFGSREGLVSEVARELANEILQKVKDVIDSDLPFPDKVAQMFSMKMDFIEKNREMLRKLMGQHKSITAAAINLPEFAELSNEFFDSGKKQGYIDDSFDNSLLAAYFDVLRAGIAAKPELAARISEDRELVNDFTRLIFYGLMKKDVGPLDKQSHHTAQRRRGGTHS